jgi:hypothetical protein
MSRISRVAYDRNLRTSIDQSVGYAGNVSQCLRVLRDRLADS